MVDILRLKGWAWFFQQLKCRFLGKHLELIEIDDVVDRVPNLKLIICPNCLDIIARKFSK